MTPGGQQKLRDELRHLKEVERPKNALDLGTAREHGDLKENAEYHAARDRQSFIEGRIKEIESSLSRAEVIDPSKLSGPKIRFGATVTLSLEDSDTEVTYQIVGPTEANIDEGTINVSAPIARALLGKEEGDEVQLQTPGGPKRCYEILSVVYK